LKSYGISVLLLPKYVSLAIDLYIPAWRTLHHTGGVVRSIAGFLYKSIALLLFCNALCSCSGSPRYTRGADSLDIYTPQHLERRVRCPQCTSDKREFVHNGKASYYGAKFHGRKTASGERYDQHQMTAAHRTLPFGTMVKVTNLANNSSVTVRINDRGPQKKSRIIDISYAAAQQINMLKLGIASVSIDIVSLP